MKPSLEKIEKGYESSFSIRRFEHKDFDKIASWHFHPEFEIVYLPRGCRGKRHIGDHISYFDDGDLIFLGPDLPHFGFSQRKDEDHIEIVVQMKEDFLGKNFLEKPEMEEIKQLLEKARLGLSFYGNTKEVIGLRLQKMMDLNPFDRLMELLGILQFMATSEEYQLLNASGFAFEVNPQDHNRIELIYQFVENHFTEPITLEQVADVASMTVPGFCRFFKKLTGLTFTKFVNEFRVAYARRLLKEQHKTIAEICFECGFNNFSHFNKTFKEIVGKSPSAYRKSLRELISASTVQD